MQERKVPSCCNDRLLSFMAHRSSDGLRVFKERSALGEQAMDGSLQILGRLALSGQPGGQACLGKHPVGMHAKHGHASLGIQP